MLNDSGLAVVSFWVHRAVGEGLVGASEHHTIKRTIELNHYSYLNYLLFVKVIVAAWKRKLLAEVVEV